MLAGRLTGRLRARLEQMPANLRGCLLMLVAMLLFAAMHAAVRHVTATVHPFEAAFFRNLFGFIMLAPVFLSRGFEPLRTRRLPLHCLRALFNVAAMLMFFMALSMTPLALIQALSFAAPLYTAMLAVLLLGERLDMARVVAFGAGIVGMLIIVRPGLVPMDLGVWLVTGSTAIWSVCLIIIKRLSATDSAMTITLYMTLLMTPLTLLAAVPFWSWPSPVEYLWLIAGGLFGTYAQLLMAEAMRIADATLVLPLDFTKIIWGAALGWLFFGELVDVWTWMGAIVIFAGAIWLTLQERKGGDAASSG